MKLIPLGCQEWAGRKPYIGSTLQAAMAKLCRNNADCDLECPSTYAKIKTVLTKNMPTQNFSSESRKWSTSMCSVGGSVKMTEIGLIQKMLNIVDFSKTHDQAIKIFILWKSCFKCIHQYNRKTLNKVQILLKWLQKNTTIICPNDQLDCSLEVYFANVIFI